MPPSHLRVTAQLYLLGLTQKEKGYGIRQRRSLTWSEQKANNYPDWTNRKESRMGVTHLRSQSLWGKSPLWSFCQDPQAQPCATWLHEPHAVKLARLGSEFEDFRRLRRGLHPGPCPQALPEFRPCYGRVRCTAGESPARSHPFATKSQSTPTSLQLTTFAICGLLRSSLLSEESQYSIFKIQFRPPAPRSWG